MSHFNRVKQSSPFRHSLISPKSFTNVFPADNPHHPIQTPSCSSRQTFSRRRRRLRHSAAHSCIHYSLILDTRLVSWRLTRRNRKKIHFPARSQWLWFWRNARIRIKDDAIIKSFCAPTPTTTTTNHLQHPFLGRLFYWLPPSSQLCRCRCVTLVVFSVDHLNLSLFRICASNDAKCCENDCSNKGQWIFYLVILNGGGGGLVGEPIYGNLRWCSGKQNIRNFK